MAATQWPKEVGPVRAMEGIGPNSVLEKKARPQEQLNCPRCNSTNTKFCYYNNYSLTQPRYFCKTCRRYWTEGGSLRNVPVGGGSRKNKKVMTSSSSSSSLSTASPKVPDLNPPSLSVSTICSQNPKMQRGHDLNLAFPDMEKYHGMSQYVEMPKLDHSSSSVPTSLSAVEILQSNMASSSRGLNPYFPNSLMSSSNNAIYPSGFPMQEIKPNLGFSIDGLGNGSYGVQETGGRVLFPFGDMKQLSAGVEVEHNKEQGNSTGYWTGMINGGSSW